jgi:hypothetical protein
VLAFDFGVKHNILRMLAERGCRVTVVPATSTPQPSWRSAASITRVSSESSRSWTTVVPWHKADSSSTRLEMLLEPGRVTVPDAPCSGGRSRKAVENMVLR